ncbi:MAG: SRPBCC family protein [Phycisphaerales bacterium]|nr:SRPBCC family protein [Planctomycetota bacterium]MCH8508385.1 SRPBCC family protein [Phycisphaerales bacterium]
MPAITVTETIAVPQARVFAAAADIPGAAGWIRGIEQIEVLTPAPDAPDNLGPVGRGFVWRETRTFMGKQAEETMTITAWSPPHHYAAEARSHGSHYLTTLSFHTEAPNTTRVTATFRGTPETFTAKVFWTLCFFMKKTVAKCLREDLADLKTHCES